MILLEIKAIFKRTSKLFDKREWYIKFFNNLSTKTVSRINGIKADNAREIYFTSTLDILQELQTITG
jgi:hypothetical protein